jgi:hypothetical protein
MNKRLSQASWGGAAYILLLCLACHWMLLLNDGFFWDDNVYYGLIQGKHYEEFSTFILETGLPINILFFRGLDLLVGITNHRWVSFVTIFLSAVLLNDLFKRFAGEFKSLSLVFTTLYLTLFPFKSTVLLCTTVYQVMLLFFILAVYIRVRYGADDATRVRALALLAFSVLSFISFNTASILVLFYFYLAFEYFYSQGFARSAWAVPSMWAYARRNLLVLLLPVIYWVVKNTFFPTHGLYVNYNKINFDLQKSASAAFSFASAMFKYGPLYNVVTKSQLLFVLIMLLLPALTAFPRAWDWARFHLPPVRRHRGLWLFWAVAFLGASALPYAMVQIGGRYQGWESRHFILFTLSMPIFVLVAVGVYLDRIKAVARMESIGFIFRPVILCIALLGAVSSNMVYLDYQALAIKQWSVVETLKTKPELKEYSSFWVDDQVGDFSKRGFTWYEATHQSWYEWVAIFTKAWGGEKWFGNNVDEPQASFYKGVRYSAADINPDGEQCRLTLRNTTEYGQYAVIRKYWAAKYFGTDEELRQFLLSIASIESCLDANK